MADFVIQYQDRRVLVHDADSTWQAVKGAYYHMKPDVPLRRFQRLVTMDRTERKRPGRPRKSTSEI